jgi:hypothetical protein
VKQHHPDIMRKGGEYDAWLVKEKETGENLSGFENWLSVEGAYIQRLILGPLHTFGLLDLGKRHQEPDFSSFRKSNWFKSLSAGKPPDILAKTNEKLLIEPNGLITIDKQFSPELRYMLARCCTWEKALGNRYIYRIDAAGLKAMRGQGIAVNILINLIQSYGRKPIPENIVKALSRWEINGNESIIRPALLLSVKSGEILDQLCAIPENKWIARRLNATCAELTEGSENQVRMLLLKMGVFADIRPDL